MIDQLVIGSVASYDDYDASVASRKIDAPKKKSIKETVPFSNKTHDFSAINGEVYWEERTLEYVFEILADSPEELAEKVAAFESWVMNVMSEKLHDPLTLDYHFIATYDDIDIDDSEIEKATITVWFTAYPYKIANMPKVFSFELTATEEASVRVMNDSSHRITPTFSSDVPFTVKKGGISYSAPAGETTDDSFKIDAGMNQLTLLAAESGTLKILFHEEVF